VTAGVTRIARADERPYEDAPPEIVQALGGKPPTVQQWRAIAHPLTPGVVIAGAGSGKTAVMAARVVYLALVHAGRLEADHEGTAPSEMLCLTFTNKAAEELARRVADATSGLELVEGEEPTVLTYHAFAAQLLEDYGLRMGIEPGQRLLSDAQRWQMLTSLLGDMEFEAWEIRSDYIVGEAVKLADQLANHTVTPEQVVEHARELAATDEFRQAKDQKIRAVIPKRIELAGLVAAYRDRKREIGAIDYGDQIQLACELVEEHPDVVGAFRERYGVVLLDEYQDTNVAQARLLRTLCGRGYPVLAVGDPDQNIYAWRGASLHNILRFQEDFGASDHGDGQLPLYVNFRSGSRILNVANRVMEEVAADRRAVGKELHPDPERSDPGRVEAFMATHDRAEAEEIARIIGESVGRGNRAHRDFAILCRKKRLMQPIAEVLRERGIPVEVVDLGGLLVMPEVVDVVAWLRILDDPARNVPLARILQGPRWRIGYRDLAALARWFVKRNRELGGLLPGEDDAPGDIAFSLAEAIDHADEAEGLSEDARSRLAEFRALQGELRDAAKGSPGDLVEQIVERTGIWDELGASTDAAAVGAKRNLLNFSQQVSAFSPLEGETSLATLVDWLDTAEETEEELEPAQPSAEDTVKILTIHKAKGLEWPVVFVPGLAEHDKWWATAMFPDVTRQPNPLYQAATLPFELRGDRDVLPRYEGKLKAFKEALRERGMEEERRLCYVALTRAKDLLVVSCAYWYEGPADPFKSGRFIDEIATHPDTEILFHAESPEESPLVEARRQRAARWPRPGGREDRDDLFPEGWRAAAFEAFEDVSSVERRADSAGVRNEMQQRLSADLERAALIEGRTRANTSPPVPSTLSVSGVLEYLRCPKLFFWSQVRPLPRRPSPAARLGSQVHGWIERKSRGQASLLELETSPDLSIEERLGEPGKEQQLKRAFLDSAYADRVPIWTERPFLLFLDGTVVVGRIDAIYGEPDGPWEVVDYKTGRVPPEGDPLTGLQLDLYALACAEVWGKRPEDVELTYLYLAEGKRVSRPAGDPAETRARVVHALRGIAERRFDATPGEQCRWCDFLAFCEPGRAWLEAPKG